MSPEDRVELIFDALDTVFDRSGIDGTTMDAIATQAGMSKRTLYGLFADRDQLFGAYMERIRGEFVHKLTEEDFALPLEERLRRLLSPCRRTLPSGLPVAVLRIALAGEDGGPRAAQGCLARWLRQDRALIRAELDRAVGRGEARIPDTAEAALVLESMVRPSVVDILLDPAEAPDEASLRSRFETGLSMFLSAVAP